MKGSTVAIIQRELLHYRVPFYEHLRAHLRMRGTDLRLLHGASRAPADRDKRLADVPWATAVDHWEFTIGGKTLMWQRCLRHLRGCDLIIVEQASRLLLNYVLLVRQSLGLGARVAYWGHGRNLKTYGASAIGEAVKRFTSRRVDWWFAYNDLSAEIIESIGFPPSRLTSVQNAIDTTRLSAWYDAVTPDELDHLRRSLNLQGHHVGLYIGSLYPEKRLSFLIASALRIRQRISDFELILVGGGEDEQLARDADRSHRWVHYAGPKFGRECVPYFALADVALQPGIVGLGILDGLACRTPTITTAVCGHGPEIAYLQHDQNGLVVQEWDDVGAYADAVVSLLQDPQRLAQLSMQCRVAASQYTIENMAARFAAGIHAALEHDP